MVLGGPASARAPGHVPAPAPGRHRRARGVLAGLGLLLALAPAAAGAVEPPSPALLPVLAGRCDSAGMARIVTHRSTRFVQQVRLEADAVVLAGPRRVALVEVGTPADRRDTRLPWAEVESLSLGRSRTREGLVLGSLAGLLVGGAIVGAYGPDLPEHGDNLVLTFAVLAGASCAGLGALLGAVNPEWTRLYP